MYIYALTLNLNLIKSRVMDLGYIYFYCPYYNQRYSSKNSYINKYGSTKLSTVFVK